MLRALLVTSLALVLVPLAAGAPHAPKQCNDRADNDADGLIDLADPGCASKQDNDEYNAPPPPPPAELRDAVVLINFTNDQSQPYTIAEAQAVLDTTAAFYAEASYGRAEPLTGDVFGWWTVPYPNSPCDTATWKAWVQQRGLEQGINFETDYDLMSLVWPRSQACGFNSRVGTFHNGDFEPYSLAHELGHFLHLNHANGWICSDVNGNLVPLSTTCQINEYGDQFDTMGSSFRHFNGWEKQRLGWLTNTQTVTQSGTYTIAPLEWQSQSSPQQLFISRNDGSVFCLEFRQPYGFDPGNTSDFTFNGVMIRVAPVMSQQTAQTFLLDAHPGGTLAWFDAPFAPGEALVDGSISISVLSVSPNEARVEVALG